MLWRYIFLIALFFQCAGCTSILDLDELDKETVEESSEDGVEEDGEKDEEESQE